MKRILVFVLAMLLAMPLPALAQRATSPYTGAKPLFKRPMSIAETIDACRGGGKTKPDSMWVTCDQFRDSLNMGLEAVGVKEEGKPLFLQSNEAMLQFLETLSDQPCPLKPDESGKPRKVILSRLLPNNVIELGSWSRTFGEETCAYSGMYGLFIYAESCGNAFGERISVFRTGTSETLEEKNRRLKDLESQLAETTKQSAQADKARMDAERKQREAEKRLRERSENSKEGGPSFLSPKRTSGKVFWFGVVPAAVGLGLWVAHGNLGGCAKAKAGPVVATACGW